MPQPNPDLAGLTSLAFALMLVLCLCAGAVMLLPGLGEHEPPAVLRVGTAVGLAVLLTPTLAPAMLHQPDGFLRLAGMVSVELLAGGVLGWLARMLALALPIPGQMISLQTVLSSVLQQDSTGPGASAGFPLRADRAGVAGGPRPARAPGAADPGVCHRPARPGSGRLALLSVLGAPSLRAWLQAVQSGFAALPGG